MHSTKRIQDYINGIIGRHPRNIDLYNECFCHRSVPGHRSNERLECLGDSVLGMIACEYLYNTYPDIDEGMISRLRMKLMNSSALSEFSASLGLPGMVLMAAPLAHGQCKIFQDVFEALVGALYLDMGYHVVFDWCKLLFQEHFPPNRLWSDCNYKDILNKLQKQLRCQVSYTRMGNSGTPHTLTYHVRVTAGSRTARGVGRTVKQAEQDASLHILHQLGLSGFITGQNAKIQDSKILANQGQEALVKHGQNILTATKQKQCNVECR